MDSSSTGSPSAFVLASCRNGLVMIKSNTNRFDSRGTLWTYAAVMYPGALAVSMRKYVYVVLLLAHTVPLPPTREVEHE